LPAVPEQAVLGALRDLFVRPETERRRAFLETAHGESHGLRPEYAAQLLPVDTDMRKAEPLIEKYLVRSRPARCPRRFAVGSTPWSLGSPSYSRPPARRTPGCRPDSASASC